MSSRPTACQGSSGTNGGTCLHCRTYGRPQSREKLGERCSRAGVETEVEPNVIAVEAQPVTTTTTLPQSLLSPFTTVYIEYRTGNSKRHHEETR